MESFASFEHEGWQRVARQIRFCLGQFDAAIHSAVARCGGRFGRNVSPGFWLRSWLRLGRRRSARCKRARFDAEHAAGVRTAGLLARQTPARLHAIQSAIEESVRRYAKADGFAIPTAGYIIAASKKERIAKEEERRQREAA